MLSTAGAMAIRTIVCETAGLVEGPNETYTCQWGEEIHFDFLFLIHGTRQSLASPFSGGPGLPNLALQGAYSDAQSPYVASLLIRYSVPFLQILAGLSSLLWAHVKSIRKHRPSRAD